MSADLRFGELLSQRLPLPLARLHRRAHNAKTALERHLTAFSLWEAGLKLLASAAVVEYARRGRPEPSLAEVLRNLARPSLGHWWDFARRLLPVLGDAGDPGFQHLRDLLLGKTRDDLPRVAGLDAALLEALGPGKAAARATVRLTELFDRLVRYRNTVLLGHAAPGQLPESFHEHMAAALLAGTAELLGRLDVLAGRRLLYVGEVRQAGGVWLVERFTLAGESPQRIATLELPRSEAARLPDGQRLYLDGPGPADPLCALHPLLLYDAEAEDVLFLNARRGKTRTEYLCYTSGRTAERPDLGGEQRELLARALGLPVSELPSGGCQPPDDEDLASGVVVSGGRQPPESRRTLGEFELLSELGRGGMGVVYRAWQPSLGRQVALKKLLHGGDTRTEARFRREIKALGHVEHPHLVKVFTSGADGDDWFFVMELVEGAPLSDVCARLQSSGASASAVDIQTWQEAVSTVCLAARQAEKPLSGSPPAAVGQAASLSGPPQGQAGSLSYDSGPREGTAPVGRSYVRQVAELMRQAAEAAHALHEKGVLHRDIKPGNILVTADGSQAVLMDLGLAQIADDEEGRLTRTRQFVGTLRYASPQQVLAVGQLDRRSDVYSLGATLWELLALRPLYGATDETPTLELMEKIQRQEPERLRRYHPGLSRDLEAIVFKCLEKEPGRRYASAAELARDLGRYLDGKPVTARRVSRLERGWKWAKRRPALAALAAVLVLATAGLLAVWLSLTVQLSAALQRAQATSKDRDRAQVEALLTANPQAVPALLAGLAPIRDDVLPRLRDLWAQPGDRARRTRVGLALLPVDPSVKDQLYAWMLQTDDPQEMLLLRDALRSYGADLAGALWQKVDAPQTSAAERFRALVVLASFDPASPRWAKAGGPAVEQFLAANPLYLGLWKDALRPVRTALIGPLGEVFRGPQADKRLVAANVLADYAADQPDLLAELVQDTDDKQFAVLFPKLGAYRERVAAVMEQTVGLALEAQKTEKEKERLAHRQANAAVVLLRLGQPDKVWPLLKHPAHPQGRAYGFSDPRVRSYLVHSFGPLGADAAALVKRLKEEPDLSIQRALILSLGPEEYGNEAWTPEGKKLLLARLRDTYCKAPDPGLHAAAEWLLRQWHEDKWLRQTTEAWKKDKKRRERASRAASAPGAKPQWYVNGQGQTMVIIPGPVEFVMGSPDTEEGRSQNEQQHRVRIGRTFAVAAKPVTLGEYQSYYRKRYGKAYPSAKDARILASHTPKANCPVNGINWYMAAEYCNWLSAKENLDKCYEEDSNGHVIGLKQNYLDLTGYRLPQEAEWEYACRAAALTSRYYGESEELLGKYAWFLLNAKDRTWPVGSKKPNDLGLFDMHGNVWCWCQDRYRTAYPQGEGGEAVNDIEDILSINRKDSRVQRGGSLDNRAGLLRSALRLWLAPANRIRTVGFRPARTFR